MRFFIFLSLLIFSPKVFLIFIIKLFLKSRFLSNFLYFKSPNIYIILGIVKLKSEPYVFCDYGNGFKEIRNSNGKVVSSKRGLNWGPSAYVRDYFQKGHHFCVVNSPLNGANDPLRVNIDDKVILNAMRKDEKITDIFFDKTFMPYLESLPKRAQEVIGKVLKNFM